MSEVFPFGFTAWFGGSLEKVEAEGAPVSHLRGMCHGETSHGHIPHKRELQGCPYLEGALVNIHIKATIDPLGLAEEDEVLKEEDMSLALPAAQPDGELILPHQLSLLLQVYLDTEDILVRLHQHNPGSPRPGLGEQGPIWL